MRVFSAAIAWLAVAAIGACAPKEDASKAERNEVKVEAAPNPDTRRKIILTPDQRHQVLSEMRQLLASSQGVIEGVAYDDLEAVADAAALSAPKAPGTVDMRMRDVLPDDFRQMGMATHKAFGAMAQRARDGASTEEITKSLAETMNYCTACHSTFQISVVE